MLKIKFHKKNIDYLHIEVLKNYFIWW